MVPAFKGLTPVDTTGAGNAFTAGFLAGVASGWDLYQCGLFANATGAHCIMAAGASTGIRSMAEIQAFIEEHPQEGSAC
jgi:fructokinase